MVEEFDRTMVAANAHLDPSVYSRSSEIIRSRPDLVEIYLTFLRDHPYFENVLGLIDKAPTYAQKLRPVFEQAPLLLSIYSRWGSHLESISSENRSEEPNLRLGRILPTLNPEIIKAHLDSNAALTANLGRKLSSFAEQDVAYLFENDADMEVRVRKINNGGEDNGAVLTSLVAANPEEFDFPGWSLKLTVEGLIDARRSYTEMHDAGYLFDDRILNEQFLVETLSNQPYHSEALKRALETDDSIINYATKRGYMPKAKPRRIKKIN